MSRHETGTAVPETRPAEERTPPDEATPAALDGGPGTALDGGPGDELGGAPESGAAPPPSSSVRHVARLLASEAGLTFRRPRNLAMLGVLAVVPVLVGVAVRLASGDAGARSSARSRATG